MKFHLVAMSHGVIHISCFSTPVCPCSVTGQDFKLNGGPRETMKWVNTMHDIGIIAQVGQSGLVNLTSQYSIVTSN